MDKMISVNFDAQTVSARELHERLKIGTEFAKWFSRMVEYGFSDKADYSEVIVKNDENSKGGRPAKDSSISSISFWQLNRYAKERRQTVCH